MRLLRYGPLGSEKPGLLDRGGGIRDLSAHVPDITAEAVTPAGLRRLAALDPESLPVVAGTPRIGVPVRQIGKFIAIGLNYADHAKEANLAIPAEPPMFTKAISCLSGPNDDVMLPKEAVKGDWEVELGLIIGRTTRYVSDADALDSVAGYVLANDVSERGLSDGARYPVGQGQGMRHFRPGGSMAGDPR